MPNLAVFDIDGTAVKCSLWEENSLSFHTQFLTPKNIESLIKQMKKVIRNYPVDIEGIAISVPGLVDYKNRIILELSSVHYLHNCPIFDIFEKAFDLPIRIENDVNCAGIAEMNYGVGKDVTHALFLVLDTTVGGSIFINGSLYKGAHLFGGKFGLMKNLTNKTFSETGTIVKATEGFEKVTGETIDGKQLFRLASLKDKLANELLDTMYENISQVLYDLQVALDPEMIIIGGTISEIKEAIDELQERLYEKLVSVHSQQIMPVILACQFKNDAKLIGAARNFIEMI